MDRETELREQRFWLARGRLRKEEANRGERHRLEGAPRHSWTPDHTASAPTSHICCWAGPRTHKSDSHSPTQPHAALCPNLRGHFASKAKDSVSKEPGKFCTRAYTHAWDDLTYNRHNREALATSRKLRGNTRGSLQTCLHSQVLVPSPCYVARPLPCYLPPGAHDQGALSELGRPGKPTGLPTLYPQIPEDVTLGRDGGQETQI